MNINIKLGSTVRDFATGLEGYVIQKVEHLGGNIQYSVQPQGDGKTLPDAYNIDYHTLDVVDEGISARASEPIEATIQLGQEVRDVVSDFEGIVTMRVTYINGCVRYAVLPQINAKALVQQEVPPASFIDQGRLKVIGDGLMEKDAPKTTEIKDEAVKPARPTGGPSTRSARF